MIGTVVRVGLLRIWHGRVALLLDFAVPIAFFTIFAFIFGGQVGLGKSPRVNVALVDEDATDLSRKLLAALAEQETLRIYSPERAEGGSGHRDDRAFREQYTRDIARRISEGAEDADLRGAFGKIPGTQNPKRMPLDAGARFLKRLRVPVPLSRR